MQKAIHRHVYAQPYDTALTHSTIQAKTFHQALLVEVTHYKYAACIHM